jgi:hypothetical protein
MGSTPVWGRWLPLGTAATCPSTRGPSVGLLLSHSHRPYYLREYGLCRYCTARTAVRCPAWQAQRAGPDHGERHIRTNVWTPAGVHRILLLCDSRHLAVAPPMQPRGSISKTQHHTTGNPGSIDVLVCGSAALLEARPARCDCLEGHAEIPIRINIIL